MGREKGGVRSKRERKREGGERERGGSELLHREVEGAGVRERRASLWIIGR